MSLSIGWFCLFGGVVGALRVSTAKKLYRSDFANTDGVIAKEDFEAEVPMTTLKRWTIVGVCVVIATFRVFKVQQDHTWNPFGSGTEVAPVNVRQPSGD
jgi:hypothetical protein